MSNQKLKIAISPCPNDTFIFGAWINAYSESKRVYEFEVDYLDIQELNEQSLTGQYDLIKISAAFVPNVLNQYKILNCGGALTEKTGPLLIARDPFSLHELKSKNVLLPGKDTTAGFMFRYLFPETTHLSYAVFSEIENKILSGEADAGVIIHESRFNYEAKKLYCLIDLGKAWFEKTHTPVPLGLIAIKKSMDILEQQSIQQSILNSILWARQNKAILLPYIQSKAYELDLSTINQHIELYVNNYSLDLGQSGRKAILHLCSLSEGREMTPEALFI